MDVWGFSSGQRQNRQQGKENIFIFSIVIKFEILHQLSPYFANIYVGRKSARSQTTFFITNSPSELAIGGFGTETWCSNNSPGRTAWDLYEEWNAWGDTISDILEKISLKRGYNIIKQILHHSKCAQLECFQFHLEHL